MSKAPKLRFPEFKKDNKTQWEEKTLGEVIEQKNERNKKLEIVNVLSINNKKGFITQEEQFNGYEVASKDLSKYKIVKKGYFGYNPSRINVGSIAKLESETEGIVSPMYVVFDTKKEINSDFLLYQFDTHSFKNKIKEGATGSVRDTLNFEDLSKFSFHIPSIAEQQKIADCLSSLDELIEEEIQALEQLKAHKKGLLQQLFA